MKRFLNPKFVFALIFGATLVTALSRFSNETELGDEHFYGDPDGEISQDEAPSLVD